jgi:acyl carrier protein
MGETVGITEQVLEVVAEIVEVDRAGLTEATVLAEIGWDSLAAVGFIAASDERFGKAVAPKRLATCVTVADLVAVIRQ